MTPSRWYHWLMTLALLLALGLAVGLVNTLVPS